MTPRNRLVRSVFALILVAGCALAAPAVIAKNAGGAMLTNCDRTTLHMFDKDIDGVSNCAGECAAFWLVLVSSGNDKAKSDFAVIYRVDGTKQWNYYGKPLYTFARDGSAAEVKGDCVKGVLHIARPCCLRADLFPCQKVLRLTVLEDIEASIPVLRRYTRAVMRDDVKADDLVQDCLERAVAKRHLWRGEG